MLPDTPQNTVISHGFWIILPSAKVIFTLYLSLRKGLTHRLRLLGIEKHAKRLSAPRECRSKLTAGRPENAKCFGRFGTNAALCQIEGPRFRQRPCAVPFFGKRDVPFDRRRRSRLAGRRQGRPHIRHDRPAVLAERERLWRRRLGRN